MDSLLINFSQSSNRVILNLKNELKSIRTGRATPSLVENLIVETYGGQAKLKLLELASITTEGTAIIAIIPFDPSVIQDIEKAIFKSPLGISPAVQGNRIIVKLPALSQEQREKLFKVINSTIEEKKGIIRNLRDNERKTIKTRFEAKEITEDNKYRLEKEIDNITQKYMEEIKTIRETKEKEIMEV